MFAQNLISNGGAIQNPNPTNVYNAYDLFYPGKVLDDNFRDSLLSIANQSSTTSEKWKNILLTLCMSSGWQAP